MVRINWLFIAGIFFIVYFWFASDNGAVGIEFLNKINPGTAGSAGVPDDIIIYNNVCDDELNESTMPVVVPEVEDKDKRLLNTDFLDV